MTVSVKNRILFPMLNFIVNAKSGKGLGNKTLKKLCDYCYKNNVPFTAHITAAPNHATAIAEALCAHGAETIVAVGGDGTFGEVLNGIADFEKTALGFIPAGRGNDYARAARLKLKPVEALKDILRGETVYSDYIDVSGRRCLNVAGTGLDVSVLERVQGKSGKITYLKALIHCLSNFSPFKLNVTANGQTTYYECIMAGVCNGTAFGGGIKLNPLGKLGDGKLDVIIMRMPDNGKLMRALIKFKSGKHLKMPYTTHIVCDEVSVTSAGEPCPIQIDGEIFGDKALVCKIIKGGMRTFKVN